MGGEGADAVHATSASPRALPAKLRGVCAPVNHRQTVKPKLAAKENQLMVLYLGILKTPTGL
jgi:hypothetical protein